MGMGGGGGGGAAADAPPPEEEEEEGGKIDVGYAPKRGKKGTSPVAFSPIHREMGSKSSEVEKVPRRRRPSRGSSGISRGGRYAPLSPRKMK